MTDETNAPKRRGLSRAAGQAAAAEAAILERARRQRVARDAVRDGPAPEDPRVHCRVLPRGHAIISMGQHIPGVGDACYEQGETFTTPQSLAQPLHDGGYLEILGLVEAEAAEEAPAP